MLIATDIGNSSITIGYFTSATLLVQRIPTHPLLPADEYRLLMNDFIRENNIEKSGCAGIISSVVQSHTAVLKEAMEGLFENGRAGVLVLSGSLSGLDFLVDNPEAVGADRIANAVAAKAFFQLPALVADFGTATTITAVDSQGRFIGGAILPGVETMNESLGMKTSKLGKVEIGKPATALGKDTAGCILSGLFIGTAGAVERIVSDIETETGLVFEVVLTGGYSSMLSRFIRRKHSVRPDLTLEGLKIIYEENRTQ